MIVRKLEFPSDHERYIDLLAADYTHAAGISPEQAADMAENNSRNQMDGPHGITASKAHFIGFEGREGELDVVTKISPSFYGDRAPFYRSQASYNLAHVAHKLIGQHMDPHAIGLPAFAVGASVSPKERQVVFDQTVQIGIGLYPSARVLDVAVDETDEKLRANILESEFPHEVWGQPGEITLGGSTRLFQLYRLHVREKRLRQLLSLASRDK